MNSFVQWQRIRPDPPILEIFLRLRVGPSPGPRRLFGHPPPSSIPLQSPTASGQGLGQAQSTVRFGHFSASAPTPAHVFQRRFSSEPEPSVLPLGWPSYFGMATLCPQAYHSVFRNRGNSQTARLTCADGDLVAFQPANATNPSQERITAIPQATQLAHIGIAVRPMVTGTPPMARMNCKAATRAKIEAASSE
jgi:hypothetical protein